MAQRRCLDYHWGPSTTLNGVACTSERVKESWSKSDTTGRVEDKEESRARLWVMQGFGVDRWTDKNEGGGKGSTDCGQMHAVEGPDHPAAMGPPNGAASARESIGRPAAIVRLRVSNSRSRGRTR
nr:hypothetical protein CFP56_53594 [Quercus suber]